MSKRLEVLVEEVRDMIGEMPKFSGPQAEFYRQQVAQTHAKGIFRNPAKVLELLLVLSEEVIKLEERVAAGEELRRDILEAGKRAFGTK